MTLHPEELRLANSLRGLIRELGTTIEDIEGLLNWEAEKLSALLDGRQGWKLGEILELLSVLDFDPAEFYALHYGFKEKQSVEAAIANVARRPDEQSTEEFYSDVIDRRFKDSQKVLEEAVSRRARWKLERLES